MQQPVHPIPRNRHKFHAVATIASILGLAAGIISLSGCGDAPPTTNEKPKPHDGVKLTFSCPDAAFAGAIEPMVRSWEARTGAKVALTRDAMTPTDYADLAVISAGQLGEWAEPGHLVALPTKFRGGDHPLQWFGFLTDSADRLAEWGAKTQAIPLTGDGYLVVYRADRFGDQATSLDFVNQFRRPLAPPATWQEFAAVAEFFAKRDKKPSLPPLSTDPARALDFFSRVASSMDRPAFSEKDLDGPKNTERMAFQFAMQTGAPRLKAPGFEAAAEWFAGLHATGGLPVGGSDDPVAALTENRAVLALVSLDQLARFPRENGAVPARFGLASVPGSSRYFDSAKSTHIDVPAPGTNYVPHFSGGRLGVVRARCTTPEVAFDLLAELGGPARSAELISTPGLGAGPTRSAHLTPDHILLWLGYGFDAERSKTLQDALRHYVGQTVKNPTYGLRGPDRAALTEAGGSAIRKLGTGAKPGDVLTEAINAWNAIDAKAPDKATLVQWRKRAAGLN
ncbi:Bacterial extracellular solute-binding protein [Gemmata sp. SH-PL17]|nr:Bacterial extracellular solute-binding protein [Gemmata sp. SH-PL17]